MPNTSNTDNCIPVWEEQLEGAVNQLAIVTASFEKQSAAYNDISNWVAQLQDCLDNLGETDAKREDIVSLLELFMTQAYSVCENVTCLKDGVKILYCDIYHMLQCMEDLYQKVLKLKNDIDCLNNPLLTPDASKFVKCLTDLQTQIEVVLELYQGLISGVLDAIKTIYKLDCLLCNKDFGLLKKLTGLVLYFGGEVDEKYCGTEGEHGADPENGKTICSESLETPQFPLTESDFYKDVASELETAETEKMNCKGQLDEMTKTKVELEACKNSLEKAIEEASKARDVK